MSSTVTCGYTAANWELNSSGQNACQVYAELQGLCNPSFTIADVTPSSAPYVPNNDACSCNIVAYNLMAGCGWCQSSIQTSWWLTISQWSGNCTSSTFDATDIPSSVSGAGQINIPAWAFAIPDGTTWSPSDAQIVAESATPTATGATNTGGTTPTGAGTTSNPFGNSGRSTTGYSYPTYTGPFSGGDDDGYGYLYGSTKSAGKAIGIALGVIAGLYALMGLIIALVYWNRQKKRQAWYGPMAQYYRDRGMGMGGATYAGYVAGAGAQAGAPLMYNQDNSSHAAHAPYPPPSASPNQTLNTHTTTSGNVYQPPPHDGTNPFNTPYGTPHPTPGATPYQPPPPEMGGWQGHTQPGTATTGGNTMSMYGTAQTNTNSMYSAPPNAPPGQYKGHAEVY